MLLKEGNTGFQLSKPAEAGIMFWILIVGVIFSLASPRFLTLTNLVNIITQSSVIGILAVGMTVVIISGGGGIDLSVGSILGISSVTMAMLIIPEEFYRETAAMLKIPNEPLTIIKAIGGAMLAGTLCGLVNGLLIALVGLPPFIATLAMMSIARGIAASISAGIPTYGLPTAIIFLGQGKICGIPLPILIVAFLAILGYFVLSRTTFGVSLYAVGGNRETARLSGMNVTRLLILVYVLNGLLAGVAAIVLAGRGNQAHPDAGLGYELYAIGAVVIGGTSLMGGKGGLIGSLLGAIFMAEVQNGINILDIPVAFMKPTLGVMIILAVILDQWQKSKRSGE
ncbi:monosaccharide-transporting ATPase [Candidatus Vecturithrix granuli]|uniref:Monosaccharide-transporting ATPase n=1 Tax=Vecturithrix granuli TaxID=1499967 RepID=A0A081CAX2_VECG1|nr:monosaccharide-transporting ATPase [Candidatus Vecturithrix granuli]